MLNITNTPARLPLLSQTAEHALRAVLYLGRNQERGLISAKELAEALGAPPNYLAKTLRLLARHGMLRSSRGPGGGFALAVPPEDLFAADVVEAVDEVSSPASCLMGNRSCDPDHPCEAHFRWADLTKQVLRPMQDTSIADILGITPGAGTTPGA
jgi:Rrf2 family protein